MPSSALLVPPGAPTVLRAGPVQQVHMKGAQQRRIRKGAQHRCIEKGCYAAYEQVSTPHRKGAYEGCTRTMLSKVHTKGDYAV